MEDFGRNAFPSVLLVLLQTEDTEVRREVQNRMLFQFWIYAFPFHWMR